MNGFFIKHLENWIISSTVPRSLESDHYSERYSDFTETTYIENMKNDLQQTA